MYYYELFVLSNLKWKRILLHAIFYKSQHQATFKKQLISKYSFSWLHYLRVWGVFDDGVGLNFLDFFTAMGVVSLSEVCGGLVLVGVDGGVDSSVMVCSPLSAIVWTRVCWLGALWWCGFGRGCCFCGGEKTNAGTEDAGVLDDDSEIQHHKWAT